MEKSNVPVLFVRADSVYKTLSNDCYDIYRNAYNYTGTAAGIYHPPCRGWGKLKALSKHTPEELQTAIWSVQQIRKFGGVLEHPRHSSLFKLLELEFAPFGQLDKFGGFLLNIDQKWFGHKAVKNTTLYIKGILPVEIPDYSICFDATTHTISTNSKTIKKYKFYGKKSVSHKLREATPINLALWMIELCERIEKSKPHKQDIINSRLKTFCNAKNS